MSVKKAIIVVAVLFLIVISLFAFFYFKKFADFNLSGQSGANLTPAQKLQQKLDAITNSAAQNPGQTSPDEVRRDVVNTINQEIIGQEKTETVAEKAARLKADEERQKTVDAINEQIKKTLKK